MSSSDYRGRTVSSPARRVLRRALFVYRGLAEDAD